MKTGKLMKFSREGGDVQAYLYRDANLFKASLYVSAQGTRAREPVHTIADPDEEQLVAEVRSWVLAHFPRPR
jgi:hypothetical protein